MEILIVNCTRTLSYCICSKVRIALQFTHKRGVKRRVENIGESVCVFVYNSRLVTVPSNRSINQSIERLL